MCSLLAPARRKPLGASLEALVVWCEMMDSEKNESSKLDRNGSDTKEIMLARTDGNYGAQVARRRLNIAQRPACLLVVEVARKCWAVFFGDFLVLLLLLKLSVSGMTPKIWATIRRDSLSLSGF